MRVSAIVRAGGGRASVDTSNGGVTFAVKE